MQQQTKPNLMGFDIIEINLVLDQISWEHLPYVAVIKSGHTTATISSSIHTFFHGSKLLTVAVLWSVAITANPGSSMDTFLR